MHVSYAYMCTCVSVYLCTYMWRWKMNEVPSSITLHIIVINYYYFDKLFSVGVLGSSLFWLNLLHRKAPVSASLYICWKCRHVLAAMPRSYMGAEDLKSAPPTGTANTLYMEPSSQPSE